MQIDKDGARLTRGAKVALVSAVLLLSGAATASVLNLGHSSSGVSAQPTYPKVSAAALSARRASSSTYGGSRYGTSRRSYSGGGYSGGK